jgi:hypothetical protein
VNEWQNAGSNRIVLVNDEQMNDVKMNSHNQTRRPTQYSSNKQTHKKEQKKTSQTDKQAYT